MLSIIYFKFKMNNKGSRCHCKRIVFLSIFLFVFSLPNLVEAVSLGRNLSGRIVLDVERHGEAWYIFPLDKYRYYLGKPIDAWQVMRDKGLGISELDFQTLAKENMPISGNIDLAKTLSGRIILEVEKNGEAWYVDPLDLKIYYLGRPIDAWHLMRKKGLGITRESLAKIHKPELKEKIDEYSVYEHKKILVKNKYFSIDLITIDLDNPRLKILTDSANKEDCNSNCPAKSLGKFILSNNAFAGINGSYFDTVQAKKNYYFALLFNTNSKKLLNSSQIKYWTTGPVVAFDDANNFYYYKDSREFGGINEFEEREGAKLQAAISNKPRLVENKLNQLIVWEVDKKQEKHRADRNALAYKAGEEDSKGKVLLVIVKQATLIDLADVLQSMDIDYALNLDGGYSSALWYNDEYMVLPGRDIPNAILFANL